jgi:hypothetical protein
MSTKSLTTIVSPDFSIDFANVNSVSFHEDLDRIEWIKALAHGLHEDLDRIVDSSHGIWFHKICTINQMDIYEGLVHVLFNGVLYG